MITIYSTDGCQQCRMTKTKLNSLGVDYIEHNITNDPVKKEEALSYGFLAAPIVVTELGEAWSGFQPDRLAVLA